jgi:outer membrane murein-binding lipoprotein Lpp
MNIVNIIKERAWQILAVLFLLLFLGRGCTSTKITKTNQNVDDLHVTVDSLSNEISKLRDKTFNKTDLKNEMERVMLDFLIYEDDLDKGKTSLSEVKNKIESND